MSINNVSEEGCDYRNAALLVPPEIVHYRDPNSTGADAILFPVYHDDTTNKTLLKCDVCGKFIVVGRMRSVARLYNHRKQTGCKRKAKQNAANLRERILAREHGVSLILDQVPA